MGAGKWRPEYTETLRGKRAVVLPDADEPGRRHGEQVARSLGGKAAEILTLALPHGKDLSEWAEAGGTAAAFKMLFEKAETWKATPSAMQAIPWRCSLDLLREPCPETSWLVDGMIPAGAAVLYSGREGDMKSWVALEVAVAVAEGGTWLGRQCEVGAVLFLNAEMPEDLFRTRLHAVGGSRNLNVWGWQDMAFPSTLDDPSLTEAAQQHRLIIVDTLKRFMEGLDENSSSDMAVIMDKIRQLTRWGTTVLVLHHKPKDPANASGYRGSTEIAAGVDVVLTVERQDKDGAVTLHIKATKTRYPVDPKISIAVTRTDTKPAFKDATGAAQVAKQQAIAHQLAQLQAVMTELNAREGHRPNQSDIIKEATRRGVGTRNTILGWLKQGCGTHWQAEADGRSLVYEPIVHLSTCPNPRGVNQLDNRTGPPEGQNLLSTCPGGIGGDRLDNRTGLSGAGEAPSSTYPVGTRIRFDGGLGFEETGIVEGHATWNQFPGQTCYRVKGRTIPQSRVLGIEGNP
jgi:hypothetical protein